MILILKVLKLDDAVYKRHELLKIPDDEETITTISLYKTHQIQTKYILMPAIMNHHQQT